jgi:hypothetical protein
MRVAISVRYLLPASPDRQPGRHKNRRRSRKHDPVRHVVKSHEPDQERHAPAQASGQAHLYQVDQFGEQGCSTLSGMPGF